MKHSAWLLIFANLAFAPMATAQQPAPDRIHREQSEILRKVERLKDLMGRLLDRYERDGKTDQVELLRRGLKHLEESRLFKAASSIESQLDNGAYDDVVRDQATIVQDLEQLLDILLDRQSLENLDEQIEQAQAMVESADALIERQRELREQANESRSERTSEAEQRLLDALADLATQQRAESDETSRQAGLRLPTLEAALARVRQLLESQEALDKAANSQLNGERDPSSQAGFEIGALETEQRELMARRDAARDIERVAEAARELGDALRDADPERVRDAHDRVRARLESQLVGDTTPSALRPQLAELLERLKRSSGQPTDDESRQNLAETARELAETAGEAAKADATETDQAQRDLAERARRAAEQHQSERDGERKPNAVGRGLERAADAMERAAKASEDGDANDALSETSAALRSMAEARRTHRDANPSAAKRADRMVAGADETSRALRNAPQSGNAEQRAADALERAEDALRLAGDELEQHDRGEAADRNAIEEQLGNSQQSLEQARQALESAMEQATEGRGEALEAARARQEALRQRATEARDRIEQARRSDELSPAQADAAQQAVEQARDSMQNAEQQLSKGQPSQASRSQSNAADALERAQRAIERNRPLDETEREAMREIADQQRQLEEDIIQLAKLAEERQNRRAQRALEEAAQAASRAAEELEDGDTEEADQEQATAEEKLEDAKRELERERDRYMDLRQEELLFRIGAELQQFLDAQVPLTEQTVAAAEQLADKGRLSRPARRKLNQIGESESELTARMEFILQALVEEGVLVFSHAIRANVEDLIQITKRLSGRRPDPGPFTVMLQRDVEERARHLIDALKREQQRREDERQQQQQQQQQGENQFGPGQQPLVPVLAELKMLRRMEEDMRARTQELDRVLAASGDEVNEFDIAMAERLTHQHSAITDLFKKIKVAIEQAIEPPQQDDPFAEDEEEGK